MSDNVEVTLYLYLVQDDIDACYPPAETIPDGHRQVPVLYTIGRQPAGKLFGSEHRPDLYEVYPDGSYPIGRPDLPCEVLHRLPADAVRLPDDEIRAYWRVWRKKRGHNNEVYCATDEEEAYVHGSGHLRDSSPATAASQ